MEVGDKAIVLVDIMDYLGETYLLKGTIVTILGVMNWGVSSSNSYYVYNNKGEKVEVWDFEMKKIIPLTPQEIRIINKTINNLRSKYESRRLL